MSARPRAGVGGWLVALATAAVLATFIVMPTIGVVTAAFTDEAGGASLVRWQALPRIWPAITTTAWIVLGSVAGAVAIGLPLAIWFGTLEFPGRRVLGGLLLLPVTLPPLVGALAVRALVHEQGMLPRILRSMGWEHAPFLDGWGGVLAVHTLTMYPLVYAFCLAAVSRIDSSQLEAARLHGAGALAALVRVLVPALRPALAASATLVAMTSLASFTAPYYFKPGGDYLTLMIFEARENDPARSILGTLLVTLMALGVLYAFLVLEGRAPAPVSRGVSRGLARRLPRGRGLLAAGGGALVAGIVLSPQATVVLLSLAQGWGWREVVPTRLGFSHFASIASDPRAAEPLLASLWMAAAAVVAAGILGAAAAWWRRRLSVPGRPLVEIACMLPFALPGTVLGLAMLHWFNRPWLFGVAPAIAGTAVLLPIAYVVRILPLVYRGTSAALATLDPAVEQAAASLGAPPAERLWRIVWPAVAPAVLAAALLAFLTAAGEFPASILLHVQENLPVSVRIHTLFRRNRFGPPFAYATVLLALQVLIVLAATWLTTRRRPSGSMPSR